jgi:hypothetical protein
LFTDGDINGACEPMDENNLPEGVTAAMIQLPQAMIPTFIPGKAPPIKLGKNNQGAKSTKLVCG